MLLYILDLSILTTISNEIPPFETIEIGEEIEFRSIVEKDRKDLESNRRRHPSLDGSREHER